MKAYKNVIYDRFNDCILIKEIGSDEFKKVEYKPYYYSTDPTGSSGVKDVYGKSVRKIYFKDKHSAAQLRESGVRLCESDLPEVVKYMHDEYDKCELSASSKDFNICFFDIEVQTGRKYYLEHKIKIQDLSSKIISEVTIRDFEDHYDKKKYLVYDEESKILTKYKDSCYISSSFPEPMQAEYPINLLTFHSSFTNQTYTWGLEKYTGTNKSVMNYRYFENEFEMLKDWMKWFNKQHFDIISGWNSALFDIPYIINRIHVLEKMFDVKTNLDSELSPLGRKCKCKDKTEVKTGRKIGETYEIPGLISIDYMELYKKFSRRGNLPSYKLDYVGNLELNIGKLEYEGQINQVYRDNWNRYVEYNIQDVNLLVNIENKMKIFDLTISFAYDCIINLDRVFSMIATVEGFILKYLHNNSRVMNDKNSAKVDWWHEERMFIVKEKDGNTTYQNCEWEKGLYDFEPFAVKAGFCYGFAGRYKHEMNGDIVSSYPHHIMMYNISPETLVIKPTKEQIESGEVIRSEINGVGFRRTDDAILPSVVKKVFAERAMYKKLKKEAHEAGDFVKELIYDNLQLGKKEIINSVYGVSLNSNFHLFNIDCARSITRCARVTIRYIKAYTNKYYVSRQILKDSVNYFPTINLRYNNKDHWYRENDMIKVHDMHGQIFDMPVKNFDPSLYMLDV